MTHTQAVIFDMDGTIADTEPLSSDHLRQFLLSIGIKNLTNL